jgi:4-hydroxy-2-oxoheptanedioate aldolase
MTAESTETPVWARRRNRFKEALKEGKRPPIAVYVEQEWPGVIEILGAAGADAAFLDLEHRSYGVEEVERLIISCEAAGITPIVRPPGIDPFYITRVLDSGAQGIVFAGVETADEAEFALSCLRHAPRGLRGWGGAHTRVAAYQGGYAIDQMSGNGGSPKTIYSKEYIEKAEDLVALFLVESVRGVENIEAIAAVPGIDAIAFGFGDYSVEVGFDPERCQKASLAVAAACVKNGVGRGLSAKGAASLEEGSPFYPGCYVTAGVDTLVIGNAITACVERGRKAAEAYVQAAASAVGA